MRFIHMLFNAFFTVSSVAVAVLPTFAIMNGTIEVPLWTMARLVVAPHTAWPFCLEGTPFLILFFTFSINPGSGAVEWAPASWKGVLKPVVHLNSINGVEVCTTHTLRRVSVRGGKQFIFLFFLRFFTASLYRLWTLRFRLLCEVACSIVLIHFSDMLWQVN